VRDPVQDFVEILIAATLLSQYGEHGHGPSPSQQFYELLCSRTVVGHVGAFIRYGSIHKLPNGNVI
jgi:hypothetical protein